MTDKVTKEWVLPASIPFADLKGKDLEECVYWLLDALGAKDLEWRAGGGGSGAADGGRDLEARFYTPGADSEIESQIWWIECKGRAGTVEAEQVRSAVVNTQARTELDYVVIATNSQFSNPTRDWVREWQGTHPRPKVRLWDRVHLERLLSRHPDVVLRLFSEALSLQGRFKALESRFWNKLEFVAPSTLGDLWNARGELDFTAMGMFAAVVNEFANGDIGFRQWGSVLAARSLIEVLQIGLTNTSYLMMRSYKAGIDTKPIFRTHAYLILCALDVLPAEAVTLLVEESIYRGKREAMPEDIQAFLLTPIMDQLLSEIQDVCSSDCVRVSLFDRKALSETKDEVKDYWLRFDPDNVPEPTRDRYLLLEQHDAPCAVGFPVNKESGCPLFRVSPEPDGVGVLLATIQRVAAFRRAQALDKRRSEKAKEGQRGSST